MQNLFGMEDMAAGYARSRPAVHPHVIARVDQYLERRERVGRALDVGCGAGLSTKPLERLAHQCVGIEPAERMLRWGSAVAPGAMFLAGHAEAMPIRAHSIDLMTAAGSLNYVDLELFFPEAARVLAPGGMLVVYDFSQGKSFRNSLRLEEWFAEFTRRYPPAKDASIPLSPESLANTARAGFAVRGQERFEVGLTLQPDFYLDYVMTETNVAFAVRNGVPAGEIRSWCAETLQPVFRGVAQEVLFRGYIAYLSLG